jgi:hypothetical protein
VARSEALVDSVSELRHAAIRGLRDPALTTVADIRICSRGTYVVALTDVRAVAMTPGLLEPRAGVGRSDSSQLAFAPEA